MLVYLLGIVQPELTSGLIGLDLSCAVSLALTDVLAIKASRDFWRAMAEF